MTVDAVIGKVTFLPKANEHFGNPDGIDRVKFTRKAMGNYLLEKDGSKITESKIYEEKGNAYTNFDKKAFHMIQMVKRIEGLG